MTDTDALYSLLLAIEIYSLVSIDAHNAGTPEQLKHHISTLTDAYLAIHYHISRLTGLSLDEITCTHEAAIAVIKLEGDSPCKPHA